MAALGNGRFDMLNLRYETLGFIKLWPLVWQPYDAEPLTRKLGIPTATVRPVVCLFCDISTHCSSLSLIFLHLP